MSAKNTSKKAPSDAPENFEAALERLETIVEEMERAELPLEDILSRYEEGSKLRHYCEAKLQEAELRVKQIKPDKNGLPETAALDSRATGEPNKGDLLL